MEQSAAPPTPPSLRRDLLLAYLAAGSKVASWIVIVAMMMRADPAGFALLALIRGTLGLLNYTSMGIGSGLIHMIASGRPEAGSITHPLQKPFSNGLAIAGISGLFGTALLLIYAREFTLFHRVPPGAGLPYWPVIGMGFGTIFRLMSDAPSGLLQAEHRIGTDSKCLIAGEVAWAALSVAGWKGSAGIPLAATVGAAYAASGALVLTLRWLAAARLVGRMLPDRSEISLAGITQLLGFGSLFVLSQLADFLYAPTDYILINRLLDPMLIVVYVPAVQIDAGLLLIVAGLSNVLLPRAANAFHAGDRETVRRYYVRGTLASVLLLIAAAGCVLVVAPILLRVWLDVDQPATRAILPLILIHTIIGGSGGVGRAVLLASGKVRPYAVSVIVGGISNVILSFTFARLCGWGLKGIVLGTVAAVTWRCAVWQPWYIWRVLRKPPLNRAAHAL